MELYGCGTKIQFGSDHLEEGIYLKPDHLEFKMIPY